MKGNWDADRDPIAALREGDPSLFEEFVRTESGSFLGYFLRQGAEPNEAEDLAQDVFLRLYDHAETYEPRERFGAYAFRVARNAWIDRRRRGVARPGHLSLQTSTRGGEHLAESLDDQREEVGADLVRHEEARRLRAALARLPEHHRSVFELGVLQELPYPEIGELLDIPVGTVKSRMFHAVRKLREALEPAPKGTPGGER